MYAARYNHDPPHTRLEHVTEVFEASTQTNFAISRKIRTRKELQRRVQSIHRTRSRRIQRICNASNAKDRLTCAELLKIKIDFFKYV